MAGHHPACGAEAPSARRRPGHPRLAASFKDVDARDKPGHDDAEAKCRQSAAQGKLRAH